MRDERGRGQGDTGIAVLFGHRTSSRLPRPRKNLARELPSSQSSLLGLERLSFPKNRWLNAKRDEDRDIRRGLPTRGNKRRRGPAAKFHGTPVSRTLERSPRQDRESCESASRVRHLIIRNCSWQTSPVNISRVQTIRD